MVQTRVQTPRRWGFAFSAGALFFFFGVSRPFRTSCWIVGMVLSSALCRCQTPEPGNRGPRAEPVRTRHAKSEGVPVVRMRARTARLIEARTLRLTTYSPGRQPRLVRCGAMAPEPDDMRAVARRAALVGGRVVRSGMRPEVWAKGLPGDWVTEVDVASE